LSLEIKEASPIDAYRKIAVFICLSLLKFKILLHLSLTEERATGELEARYSTETFVESGALQSFEV
jgi:hypothetical protein